MLDLIPVQTFNSSHAAGLSAPMTVNAIKGTINLKPLHPGQWLEFKPLHH
jgi:hypothetical protein